MRDILEIESDLVGALREVFDPEIPVNVYDLGLIYDIDVQDDRSVHITMADQVVEETRSAAAGVEGVTRAEVTLVFEPEWSQDRMSEEAKLELGLL